MLLLMNKSCLAKLKICDIILVNTVALTVHFDRQYCNQARNQGGRPQKTFSPLLEKCVGHSLKLLDIV